MFKIISILIKLANIRALYLIYIIRAPFLSFLIVNVPSYRDIFAYLSVSDVLDPNDTTVQSAEGVQ